MSLKYVPDHPERPVDPDSELRLFAKPKKREPLCKCGHEFGKHDITHCHGSLYRNGFEFKDSCKCARFERAIGPKIP